MKLFSYVVRYDKGFAPNPYGGYCTLACCKPKVRQNANVGDFVLGTGSVRHKAQNKLVFGMYVDHKLTFHEYFKNPRFDKKKPRDGRIESLGDNIYFKDKDGCYRQIPGAVHDDRDLPKDLICEFVLIANPNRFWYFGRNAEVIPDNLTEMIKKGPAYRCKFRTSLINDFIDWIESKERGLQGIPYDFPDDNHQSCSNGESCGL